MSARRSLLPTLLLVVLAGCASDPVVRLYDGPPRPLGDVVRVELPMELEVLTLNERRARVGSLFSYGTRELHLPPGEWRFVARYEQLFELGGSEHEVVKSDPALFVVRGRAGEQFRLGFPAPASVEEARALARHFDGWVENVTTAERTPSRPAGIVAAGGLLTAPAFRPDAEAPVVPDVGPQATDAERRADEHVPTDEDVLRRLQQIWEEASPEARAAFLRWLAR